MKKKKLERKRQPPSQVSKGKGHRRKHGQPALMDNVLELTDSALPKDKKRKRDF